MPRGPRLDAPGVTHHVIIRGVGGCEIFYDDEDREDLAHRLDRWVPALGASSLASVFMSNHAHWVLESGPGGLSQLMARVLTGYAQRFNLRHGRDGHLFQNRFVSEVISDDAYRIACIAYVFRNLMELGFSLGDVIASPWCSLAPTLGARPPRAFESVAKALAAFDGDTRALLAAIERNAAVRDPSQWREFEPKRQPPPVRPTPAELDVVVKSECAQRGITPELLIGGARVPAACAARRAVAVHGVLQLGMRTSAVARKLGVSRQAVAHIIEAELRRRERR